MAPHLGWWILLSFRGQWHKEGISIEHLCMLKSDGALHYHYVIINVEITKIGIICIKIIEYYFNTYWSFQINPGQTVRWKKMILWNFVATSSLLLHSKSFSKNSFVLFTFTLFSHVGAKCQCGSYLQKLKITRYFAFF